MKKYSRALCWLFGLGSYWACFAAGELPTVDSFTNAFDRQCFVFAQDFCERAQRGTITTAEAFDTDAFVDRSLKNLRKSPGFREGFARGFKFGSDFLAQLRSVRNLRVVNIRRDRIEARAVLRVIDQDGSLNYLELLCEVRRGGTIRIVDVYNWTSGELVSDALRRMLSLMEQQSLTSLQKLTGKEDPNIRLAAAVKDMAHFAKTRQWEATLQSYAQLPASLQREKFFVMLRVQAAAKTDEKEYLEALKFLQKNFPHDASVGFVAYDAAYYQRKYDVALEVVDRIDKGVGGDPFLDLVRSGLYQKLGQPDAAKERKEEALRREPKLGEFASPGTLPMLRDRRPIQSSSTSTARAGRKPGVQNLRLQGVFMRSARPAAMISGKDVREGDTVEGMQVVKIEQTQVTLQATNGELRSLTFD